MFFFPGPRLSSVCRPKLIFRCSTLTYALLVSCLMCAGPNAYGEDWLYTVRPGDKLWNLAERFCGTHQRWPDLARHNQLTVPERLQPGSQLRFPIEWLKNAPVSAEVSFVRGTVTTKTQAASTSQAARLGDQLNIGAQLQTAANSFASVRFADASELHLGPESEVLFDTLTGFGDTGMVDTRLRLTRGSSRSTVNERRGPGSVFRITTPLGVAAVRGTDFRTRVGSDVAFVEMADGRLGFAGVGGGQFALEDGEGLVADPTGVKVEELLPGPQFDSLGPTQATYQPLRWKTVAGAQAYAVEARSGARPTEVLARYRTQQTSVDLSGLAAGAYRFVLRAVSVSGLEGRETQADLSLIVQLPPPTGLSSQPNRGQGLQLRWREEPAAEAYEVVLQHLVGGAVASEQLLAADQPSLRIKGLTPGKYAVRVRSLSGRERSELSALHETTVAERKAWWPVVLASVAAALIILL